MGVVSSTADAVVPLGSVTGAAVVSGGGGCVEVITGGGVLLHEGTAHGQLHTSSLSSKTVLAGHSNMYVCSSPLPYRSVHR